MKEKMKTILNVFKTKHIVWLILLLAVNSFAWFVYATRADSQIGAHIKAWDILFEAGENEVTDYINVNVNAMYPGMEDFLYEIKASNRSEMPATISYTLLEANLLGEEIITVEGMNERGETLLGTEYTSAQLLQILEEDYPFSIKISLTNDELVMGVGEAFCQIEVVWPFESGDDAADTLWGKKSADYKKDNPDDPSIVLRVKIYITQTIE